MKFFHPKKSNESAIMANLRYELKEARAKLAESINAESEFEVNKSRLMNRISLLEDKQTMIYHENAALIDDLKAALAKNTELRRAFGNLETQSLVDLVNEQNRSATAVKKATQNLEEELELLKEEMAEVKHENAGLAAKLEAQEAMIDLAPEVQDIKDVMSQIIEKLPTININGMSQTVTQKA